MTDNIRIYLDDLRPTPDFLEVDRYEDNPRTYTHRCYTAQEAIDLLKTGQVSFISFDHDLGDYEPGGTGYDVAKYIEGAVWQGWIPMPDYAIHSANPVGVKNIDAAMKSAQRAWDDAGDVVG
jgi:hypothetical protein